MSMLIGRETSAGSEGARRATGDPAGRDAAGVPDPEVSEQAKRRRFTAEYKLRIVREADACKGDGDVAALLRREGLYSSHLSSWRRQRDEVAKAGLASRKRGRKAKAEDPRVKELERENARLQRRLARVETMLEIQKKNLRITGDPPESTRQLRERLMVAAEELAGQIGQTTEACEALGVARSTLYRRRQVTPEPKRRPRPHRALDETEREEVLGALHCERFVDKAPAQVWATLLDEGTYLCSIRTMYRILEEHGEVRERRNQRRHPNYTKPELLAEAPLRYAFPNIDLFEHRSALVLGRARVVIVFFVVSPFFFRFGVLLDFFFRTGGGAQVTRHLSEASLDLTVDIGFGVAAVFAFGTRRHARQNFDTLLDRRNGIDVKRSCRHRFDDALSKHEVRNVRLRDHHPLLPGQAQRFARVEKTLVFHNRLENASRFPRAPTGPSWYIYKKD